PASRPAKSRRDADPRPSRDATELFPTEAAREPSSDTAGLSGRPQAAPGGARALAGAIDGLLTVGIDAAVLYFTLRLCGLPFAAALTLPLVPLVAFLALLNGGYFTSFVAAGGQTIGKMAAGIRVIPADPDADARTRVPFGQAVVRAAASVVSVAPAGLGLLPAFFTPERRALHDRLADTRVVKA
ncbi:MAG TPA: RDD family protein, partial [Vicinamibacterales bacterium]|nr:RDD family protein [Vicinamibacterales bacterium]